MEKRFRILNLIFTVMLAVGGFGYMVMDHRTVLIKGLVSCIFAAQGILNLIYAAMKGKNIAYPVAIALGLALCLAGDVLLGVNFIVGAGSFALGHVCYFAGYCCLERFKLRDLIPCAVVFALAGSIVLFVPVLDFGATLMQMVCLAYAAIISCMVGKTIANRLRKASFLSNWLVVASCSFFFSDLMLVFNMFAAKSTVTDHLCLLTYYPAQALLAWSIYHYTKQEN